MVSKCIPGAQSGNLTLWQLAGLSSSDWFYRSVQVAHYKDEPQRTIYIRTICLELIASCCRKDESMEKTIISSENVKPSSPTPLHQRTYNLSLLDQIIQPLFAPIVLYFRPSAPPNLNNLIHHDHFIHETTQTLKQSLSATLTQFYPLAGRTKSDTSIDCNDKGILFVVSRIKGTLSHLLMDVDPADCARHVPCERLIWAKPVTPCSHVAMIQVNYFDCGGISIGSLFLHTVIDGTAIVTFLKKWAANALGSPSRTEYPDYTARCFFPCNESIQGELRSSTRIRQYGRTGKVVTRRYMFNSSSITTLRARTGVNEQLGYVSRVELVSALLWKCFMVACSTMPNNAMHSLLTHAVNLRSKAKPTYAQHSFGNFIWVMPVASDVTETSMDMRLLIRKLRNAIRKIDGYFLNRMHGDDAVSGYRRNLEQVWGEVPEKGELLSMISWCNFGVYDIDFGFGKPVWASRCDAGSNEMKQFNNSVWLMDTSDGGGLEAWVTLDERLIGTFHGVKELQDLALVDPSPLEDGSL